MEGPHVGIICSWGHLMECVSFRKYCWTRGDAISSICCPSSEWNRQTRIWQLLQKWSTLESCHFCFGGYYPRKRISILTKLQVVKEIVGGLQSSWRIPVSEHPHAKSFMFLLFFDSFIWVTCSYLALSPMYYSKQPIIVVQRAKAGPQSQGSGDTKTWGT